ncbi:GNAT family N-acetyltransferase [Mangrovicoccus sp. HB161399]|uniref:GNAT family N-acetyltransferase n=1 Tax=Mangrovicoccus sp. HB161399 TaxID=2720392 RepID=UPI001552F424|nr:GNAT family N-acetyltransferase [Mangrovicoccus sp. HB161399]
MQDGPDRERRAAASRVTIRAPLAADIPALTEAANQPGVRRGTLRLPFTGEEFLRRRLLEPPPGMHNVVAELEGRAIGQGALVLGQGRQRHKGEVFLFVHDASWRRGAGRAILGALLDLADSWYGLTRISLEVMASNAAAIALYRQAGFEEEGRLRADTLCEGRLEDVLAMARLRPPPERAP